MGAVAVREPLKVPRQRLALEKALRAQRLALEGPRAEIAGSDTLSWQPLPLPGPRRFALYSYRIRCSTRGSPPYGEACLCNMEACTGPVFVFAPPPTRSCW